MRRICEAFINDMQKIADFTKMQDFRSLSAAEIKKIPAVRTMRTPGNKSRQLLTQKTGLSQKNV